MNKLITSIVLAAVMLLSVAVHADDKCAVGSALYTAGKYGEALQRLDKPASRDVACAQYLIGIMYKRGEGVKPDTGLALDYIRRAAENGYSPAVFQLSLMSE